MLGPCDFLADKADYSEHAGAQERQGRRFRGCRDCVKGDYTAVGTARVWRHVVEGNRLGSNNVAADYRVYSGIEQECVRVGGRRYSKYSGEVVELGIAVDIQRFVEAKTLRSAGAVVAGVEGEPLGEAAPWSEGCGSEAVESYGVRHKPRKA